MRVSAHAAVAAVLFSGFCWTTLDQAVRAGDAARHIEFSDDFQSDRRGQYQVAGSVDRTPGLLTFSPGASLGRELQAAGSAEIRVSLAFPPAAGEQRASTRIVLAIDDRAESIVELVSSQNQRDVPAEIRISDRAIGDGQSAERLLRVFQLAADLQDGEWSVRYRYGLLTVICQNKELAVGYRDERGQDAAPLSGWRIEQRGGQLQARKISISAVAPPELTSNDARELAEAARLSGETMQLLQTDKMQEAAKRAGRVVAIRKKVLGELHPDYAQSLIELGYTQEAAGNFGEAARLYAEAGKIDRQVLGSSHPTYGEDLTSQAILHRKLGEFSAALPLFLEASRISGKVLGDDSADFAVSLHNLAALYQDLGQYAQSESHFLRVLSIPSTVEHLGFHESVLNRLAALYQGAGQYTKAEPLFIQSLQIRRQAYGEEHSFYGRALSDLASLYELMGAYTRAEPLNEQSLGILEKALGKNHPDYARSLDKLGMLYRSMGEYGRAEELLNESLRIREAVYGAVNLSYAIGLNNLALLYEEMAQYAKAESLLAQSMQVRKQALGEDHPDYAIGLNNLAAVQAAMGKYEQARPLLRRAKEIQKEALGEAHPEYARTLSNLALLDVAMGQYQEAKLLRVQASEIYRQALGEQHPHYARSLTDLAALHTWLGEYNAAEPLFEEALGVLLRAAAITLPSLSEAQAMAWLDAHQPHCDGLLSAMRRQDHSPARDAFEAVWKTRALATRFVNSGRLPPEVSPEVAEIDRRLQAARSRLAELVMAVPPAGQTQRLRDEIAAASEQKELLEKERAAASQTARQDETVRDATVEDLARVLPQDAALVQILATNHLDGSHKQSTGGSSPAETRELAGRREYDAFVLTARSPPGSYHVEWVHLGAADPIDEAITRWRYLMKADQDRGLKKLRQPRRPATIQRRDQQLRRLVWEKLEPHLDNRKTVIVIPDGSFPGLPWNALPGRQPGSYLIEEYRIGTVSYGQHLYRLLVTDPPENQQLVAAGGIDFDQRPLADSQPQLGQSLLGRLSAGFRQPARTGERTGQRRQWKAAEATGREVDEIVRIHQRSIGAEAIVLRSRDAGELALAEAVAGSGYVHLATHGFFATPGVQDVFREDLRRQPLFDTDVASTHRSASLAGRNPLLLSGIVLAGANQQPQTDELGLPTGQDGILLAEEATGLDLRDTQLVVLSACDTGLGELAGGEGVFGLQRAFGQAGARTVIASLWKVDDAATRALMVEFYRNLWERDFSTIEALRQAQLAMLRGQLWVEDPGGQGAAVTDPVYWAAWSLSGEWR